MKHEELIEKFLYNRLTSEEKNTFDMLINTDTTFKETLKEMKKENRK